MRLWSVHPLIEFLTRRLRNRSSVVSFEAALIARMLSERCLVVLNLNNFGLPGGSEVTQAQRNIGNGFVWELFRLDVVVE